MSEVSVPVNEEIAWKRPSPIEIWRMTASDRSDGGFATKAAIATMVTGIGIEWLGPNEYMLGTIGSHTLQATQNIYETGAAMSLASFTLQTAVGTTVAWALSRCPDAVDRLRVRMEHGKKTDEDPDRQLNIIKRIGGVVHPLVVGSAIELAMKSPKSEKESFRTNVRKVLGWSAIVAGGVDFIGTGGAQLVVEGEKHGFVSLANVIVNDVLPNPLTYVTIFGGAYGISKGAKAIKNKLSENKEALQRKARAVRHYAFMGIANSTISGATAMQSVANGANLSD